MLEFTEDLAAMAALDQDDVYIYTNPGWERYTGHTVQETIGRKAWEMAPDTHTTEVFHTSKLVFAKAVSANGPAFTSYFLRFDRGGKLCGLFLYIIVQGIEDIQNLTQRIGGLSSKVEFYQQELSRERGAHYGPDSIIGESALVLRLKEQTVQAVRSTSTVLIEGETGSGKELTAHSIYAMSTRKAVGFVWVNCSTIPVELMKSKFFGYAAGAFADTARKGRIDRFQLASGSSIFLDEVNLLTTTMQPKFLRVLQEVETDPVGGEKSIPIDVWAIVAPNIPLETLVEAGQFRSDPCYHLNVICIQAPISWGRKEDLPLLVDSSIHQLNYQLGMVIEGVAPGAMDLLMDYDWPGNVHELWNAVESAMNVADSSILRRRDFRQLEQRMQTRQWCQLTGPGDFRLCPARQASERELIRDALATARGNRVKAAALLDVSRIVLHEKMGQYQLRQIN